MIVHPAGCNALRSTALAFLLCAAFGLMSAQPAERGFEKEGRFVLSSGPAVAHLFPSAWRTAYVGPQPFDVLHYGITISLAMTTEMLQGKSSITLVLRSSVDSLVLNAARLALDTVTVNGVPSLFTIDDAHETFTILLQTRRAAGETLVVAVAYRRVPGVSRPSSRQGYYYFTTALGIPDTLGYTMSEPSDARFWLPCYDEPWEKATASLDITVPSGYTVASNGRLAGARANANGTTTWEWREDHQITPYLLSVTSSRLAIATLPFVRSAGDTLPVQYWVWPADSLQCAGYLPTVSAMISAFSAAYGPYPFDKYGMTAVEPFTFGGMEHQTITTLHRAYRVNEGVVAHELAHQWWGDLVTCGTWQDIWLNESFATYSEAIWKESQGGFAALSATMNAKLHFNNGSWQGAVYDPEGQGFNLFSDLVYSKGAWVLHTLRGVLGDSAFFRSLSAYRAAYHGSNATTEEFQAVVGSVAGRDMGWFFDQWVYGDGWPVYSLSSNWSNDTLRVELSQRQSTSWPTFTMPIRIRAFHAGKDTTFTLANNARVESFTIPFPYQPDSLTLDPDGWILKQVVNAPVFVGEAPRPLASRLEQNYPNPFNPKTVVSYQLPEVSDVKLAVYDLLGREVATLVNERNAPGAYAVTFDGANLPSGVYIYRLTTGRFEEVRKMVLMR